jgi:DNA-binding transcriptional MocR family regulator
MGIGSKSPHRKTGSNKEEPSWKQQLFDWAFATPTRGGPRHLLRTIVAHCDPGGETFIGQETMAEETGCDVTTVRRNLKKLVALQLIERRHRYGERGKRTSDFIKLRSAPLPGNLPGSEGTTGQSANDYRAICLPLPGNLPEESSVESSAESSPPTPHRGAGGFSVREAITFDAAARW